MLVSDVTLTTLRSQRPAHQLVDRQRDDAEHQVAERLGVAAHPHVPPSYFVLEPPVDPLHRRALAVARCLRPELTDATARQRVGNHIDS